MPTTLVRAPFGEPVPAGRAADIARGVTRLLANHGLSSLLEVTLSNGRRADVLALSGKAEVVIVEIKSCLQDFAVDQKWPEYLPFCDRFYFAVDCDFPVDRLPADAGLIVADAFGGSIVRESAVQKLSGARRKSVVLGFGRLAAQRLHRLREAAATLGAAAPDDVDEGQVG